MPDQPEHMNDFAAALQQLAPQPTHLSRDALLFAAGREAARSKLPPWLWPGSTALSLGIAFVLAAFLMSPRESGVQYVDRVEVVYVDRPATPGPVSAEPVLIAKAKPTRESSEEAERLVQVRRDVLRWGIDMLPESKTSHPGPSDDMAARDLTYWLNLPPGTFALLAHQPKKPLKEEDD